MKELDQLFLINNEIIEKRKQLDELQKKENSARENLENASNSRDQEADKFYKGKEKLKAEYESLCKKIYDELSNDVKFSEEKIVVEEEHPYDDRTCLFDMWDLNINCNLMGNDYSLGHSREAYSKKLSESMWLNSINLKKLKYFDSMLNQSPEDQYKVFGSQVRDYAGRVIQENKKYNEILKQLSDLNKKVYPKDNKINRILFGKQLKDKDKTFEEIKRLKAELEKYQESHMVYEEKKQLFDKIVINDEETIKKYIAQDIEKYKKIKKIVEEFTSFRDTYISSINKSFQYDEDSIESAKDSYQTALEERENLNHNLDKLESEFNSKYQELLPNPELLSEIKKIDKNSLSETDRKLIEKIENEIYAYITSRMNK